MIVCKPKTSTLFSLITFLVAVFGVSAYNYFRFIEQGATLNLAVIAILLPIGLGLLIRTLLAYRVIQAGKNRISIRYPLRGTKAEIPLREIDGWRETTVKTWGSAYAELRIHANGKKFTLSRQEHTEFDKMKHYLETKCRNKKNLIS